MNKSILYILTLIGLVLTSCVPTKDMIYLQKNSPQENQVVTPSPQKPYRLQTNDILNINIKSIDTKLVEAFNYNNQSQLSNSTEGNYSRDFTYIDNVIQMNELAMTVNNPNAINTVYNTAYGDRNTLNDLINHLKEYLSEFDEKIATIEVIHGPNREGDIPHSLASIDKAKELLKYSPQYSFQNGLKEAVRWYWENLK